MQSSVRYIHVEYTVHPATAYKIYNPHTNSRSIIFHLNRSIPEPLIYIPFQTAFGLHFIQNFYFFLMKEKWNFNDDSTDWYTEMETKNKFERVYISINL